MIKNMISYHIPGGFSVHAAKVDKNLREHPFHPCGPTQEKSIGWVRAVVTEDEDGTDSDLFALALQDFIVMRCIIEKKTVPGDVLKRQIKEDVKAYTIKNGVPDKEEMKLIKEESKRKLLPRAFAKQTETMVWIDRHSGRLHMDTSSASTAECIVKLMHACINELPGCELVRTRDAIGTTMNGWVLGDAPSGLTVDDKCEMVLPVTGKPSIKYNRHSLEDQEVKNYIAGGHIVSSLALTHADKISFTLTDKYIIKGVQDINVRGSSQDGEDEALFSAYFLIYANALRDVLDCVIEAAGGLSNFTDEDDKFDEAATGSAQAGSGSDDDFQEEGILDEEEVAARATLGTSLLGIASLQGSADVGATP